MFNQQANLPPYDSVKEERQSVRGLDNEKKSEEAIERALEFLIKIPWYRHFLNLIDAFAN